LSAMKQNNKETEQRKKTISPVGKWLTIFVKMFMSANQAVLCNINFTPAGKLTSHFMHHNSNNNCV